MSRTIRVQTVRSVAHNQQLFRCAVCAQCRARFAALPSRSLCAMWRAIRNSSVMQSVRSVAYKLRSSVAQCCAHCRAQSVCKLCAMPRTIRSSSVVQSVCNVAHNLLPNAAPQAVQSDAMESVQIQALYEPPLAAKPQLSEKPHQGFATRQTASHQGSSVCNFTVTLGLQATVVENGVRKTYSARYYNPSTGRFLSRDPKDGKPVDPQSLHKYLYAGGDPVNRIDPRGREDEVEYIDLNATSPVTIFMLKQIGCGIVGYFAYLAMDMNGITGTPGFLGGAGVGAVCSMLTGF